MRHGIAGIPGNVGVLESVSCRIHWRHESSNPTLSANTHPFVLNHLTGHVGSQRESRLSSPLKFLL